MQLAETLKSPIVHALGGKEHVEYDNPYDVGMTGFIGFSSGYAAMHACDVLLMLGTDFPYKQFFPTECQIAQIDPSPFHIASLDSRSQFLRSEAFGSSARDRLIV